MQRPKEMTYGRHELGIGNWGGRVRWVSDDAAEKSETLIFANPH